MNTIIILGINWTNFWENSANVATIITCLFAFINLILILIKAITSARPAPFRHQLEYLDDFGDFLANFGNGLMTIIDFTIFYKDKKIEEEVSLVDLYVDILQNEYGFLHANEWIWMTYLKKGDLINRTVRPNEELKLIEINPEIYPSQLDEYDKDYDLLEKQNKTKKLTKKKTSKTNKPNKNPRTEIRIHKRSKKFIGSLSVTSISIPLPLAVPEIKFSESCWKQKKCHSMYF